MLDIWIMAASPARRDWLLRAIEPEPGIRVAGTAPTFAFLRSLAGERPADLAVVDLHSPIDPTAARDWILELLNSMPILLLAAEPEPLIFNRMLNEKSGGMLPADASSEQVVQAIKSIASGLLVFDASLIHRGASALDETLAEPLTTREREVLGLLADGLPNRELAGRLGISEHTIKFHIRSILAKLGATSRTEAVSRGLRSGLIEL